MLLFSSTLGTKLGLAASPLSVLLADEGAQPPTNRGKIWAGFIRNRESLSEENGATQRHSSLSFQAQPGTGSATGRRQHGEGLDHEYLRQRESHNRANGRRKWKISQPSHRDLAFWLGSQASALIVLLLGYRKQLRGTKWTGRAPWGLEHSELKCWLFSWAAHKQSLRKLGAAPALPALLQLLTFSWMSDGNDF